MPDDRVPPTPLDRPRRADDPPAAPPRRGFEEVARELWPKERTPEEVRHRQVLRLLRMILGTLLLILAAIFGVAAASSDVLTMLALGAACLVAFLAGLHYLLMPPD